MANAYLEGTYSEVYPDIGQDADGLQKLFRQFSFPGGIPSHAAPETPGSIHEAASSAMRCRTPSGRRSTTPTSSWHASSATERPRPGRSPRAGTRTSSSIRASTGRPSDPASERVQDREPDRARPDPGGRASRPVPWLRLGTASRLGRIRRRGVRPRARALRCGTGRGPRQHRGDPGRCARERHERPGPLADADPPHSEGVDRAARGRRKASRRDVALAPGPARRCSRQRRAPPAARGVDAELPARRAVRP